MISIIRTVAQLRHLHWDEIILEYYVVSSDIFIFYKMMLQTTDQQNIWGILQAEINGISIRTRAWVSNHIFG